MKLLNKNIIIVCLFFAANMFAATSYAQCKSFTKKRCLPSLAPFIHNGQLTSAIFNAGETADIEMTFNAGKEYRIIACSQETLGKVKFKVLDKTRKVLYSSEDGETNPSWDFKVENTQQLIIQISIPKEEQKNKLAQFTQSGCISLLVGFK